MRKSILFSLIAIAVFSSLFLSSEVRAIVEPHIAITMDLGQTTKPFVINDNSGNEVFSVSPDGTIFPTPETGSGYNPLDETLLIFKETNMSDFVTIPSTSTLNSNPVIFAKWTLNIDRTDILGNNPEVLVPYTYVQANSQVPSGDSGQCTLAWVYRVDSGSWGLFTLTRSSTDAPFWGSTFSGRTSDNTIGSSSGTTIEIGVIGYREGTVLGDCKVRDVSASMELGEIPSNMIIQRDL